MHSFINISLPDPLMTMSAVNRLIHSHETRHLQKNDIFLKSIYLPSTCNMVQIIRNIKTVQVVTYIYWICKDISYELKLTKSVMYYIYCVIQSTILHYIMLCYLPNQSTRTAHIDSKICNFQATATPRIINYVLYVWCLFGGYSFLLVYWPDAICLYIDI